MTTIVLFGGRSDERHVSVASAQNIARTLDGVVAWFESPSGAVHDVSVRELLAHERPFELDFVPSRPAIFPDLEQAFDTMPVDDPAVLLAMHGGAGEDGTVQALLEARGIPYTGSGSAASAAAFDKRRAKELLDGRVRTPAARVVTSMAELEPAVEEMLAAHARIVLKPLAGGSSRGLFFLADGDDSAPVLAEIRTFGVPYLIEEMVSGRELTVGVIDHEGRLIALPVIEIEVDPNRTFDYAGKYLGAGTREICPARIPEALARAAGEAALEAHRALGCSGYSRTDLIAIGDDAVAFLELNTLPGLTRQSLVPQELVEAGIGFREFLEEQLRLARVREAQPAAAAGS